MSSSPRLSIIVPVRNERRALPALLDALLDQDFSPQDYEVLVVDGQSSDGTIALIREYASRAKVPVIFVDNPAILSSSGRNAGVKRASGQYIVFVDGHCYLPSRTLLRDTLRIFVETGADCLCRPQPLLAPSTATGIMIAAVRASTLGHGRDSLIYDMNYSGEADPSSSGASYCKTVFERIGFYDERFDACEDVDFNIRVRKAGLKAFTDPSLAVFYEPRSTVRALYSQMKRYGRGRMRLAFKHTEGIKASQFAPLLLLLAAVLTPVVVISMLRHGSNLWMLLLGCAPVLLYLVLVAWSAGCLVRRHGWRYALFAPVIYCTIHFGLGAGMLRELVSRPFSRTLAEHPATMQGHGKGQSIVG